MSDLDRFGQDREVLYRGKRLMITADKGTMAIYVLAKDPAGNEYFAYEAGGTYGNERGFPLVMRTVIEELKERG